MNKNKKITMSQYGDHDCPGPQDRHGGHHALQTFPNQIGVWCTLCMSNPTLYNVTVWGHGGPSPGDRREDHLA